MKKSGGKERKAQSFLQGALVLTAGMAVVKVIGALFKIPLKRVIGEYGMGIFNSAYSFYGPVFSLATAGLPVAVARLVAENSAVGRWNDIRRIRRLALPLFLLLGAAGMLLITLFAPLYCGNTAGGSFALPAMLSLAPAILFACGASAFRGYYTGLQNMIPTAVSEVIEALAKLLLGLSTACWAISQGQKQFAQQGRVFFVTPASQEEAVFWILSFAAAGAVLGVTMGSVFSFLYLALYRWFHRGEEDPARLSGAPDALPQKELKKKLLLTALPIALGSVASNAAGLIDAALLQRQTAKLLETEPAAMKLLYGANVPALYWRDPGSAATFLYGCYTLAMTVYLLVPAVTQAFGVSALPSVTRAWAKGGKKEQKQSMETVMRLSALFCFPMGIGLSALSGPITRVLYGEGDSASVIAGVLFLLGFASLPTAMSTPFASMLQAVGRVDLPVKLLFGAMGIKLVVSFVLSGVVQVNILGAALGTLFCYLFLFFSQLRCLQRETGLSFSPMLFLKPLIASLLCGLTAKTVYDFLSRLIGGGMLLPLAAGVGSAAMIYLAFLFLMGGIEKSDLLMLPKGQKIAKILEKQDEM